VNLTRLLPTCGVVGPPLFIGTFLVEGATRPGYNAWRNYVSSLATGEGGWVQIANFLVWGVLAIAFGLGVLRLRIVGPGVLLLLYGAAIVATGIFVTDPGLGYPPGVPEVRTTHGLLHSVAALAAFLLNAVAAAATAAHFVSDPRQRGFVRYSALTGLVALTLFIASTVVPVLEARGAWPNAPTGLVQRSSIIVGMAWFAVFAVRLVRAN
jgi:hypothetical membrane protein